MEQSTLRAALLMTGAMAAFTLNDAFVKLAGEAVPLFQLVTLRGLLATLLIWILARRLGSLRVRLSRADWALVLLRAASEAAATFFFLTALIAMPLANVTAVLQVLPLTVTLGAALLFGERVGWRRGAAIGVGFLGMLLIVRPGPEGFTTHAIFALAAVACVTVRDLATRRMAAAVPSMAVVLVSSLAVLAFGAVASTATPWVAVSARDAALIVGAALCLFVAYQLSVMVMRSGEVSASAPFRYSGLVFALILGWAFFGHWPEPLTMAGAALVVGSGLFTLYRERRIGSR